MNIKRNIVIGVVLALVAFGSGLVGAYAQFYNCKAGFCGGAGEIVPPPAACASPNAPDGTFDLSKCSNASWVAVIL